MPKLTIWRTVPYTNGFYQISRFGEIRTLVKDAKQFNIYTFQNVKYISLEYLIKNKKFKGIEYTHPVLKYKSKFNTETKAISSIMYEAFHGIYNLDWSEIIHIDGNEFNNDLDNLTLCRTDEKEALLNSYKYWNNHTSINVVTDLKRNYYADIYKHSISEYSMDGMLLHTYPGVAKLCAVKEISFTFIRRVICGFQFLEYNGIIYKKGIGPPIIDTHLIKNKGIILLNSSSSCNSKFVFKYDTTGKLLSVYNNLNEAAFLNKLTIEDLGITLKKNIINELNGAIWLFE